MRTDWRPIDTLAELDHPSLLGRVDALKRVTLRTGDGELALRCARVIHRWLDEASIEGRFYRPSSDGDLTWRSGFVAG